MGIIARRYKILDLPSNRKVHHTPTPLLGGTAVFFGFCVSLLSNGIFSIQLGVILMAALVLFIVGIFDDVREVPAGVKLAAQILCTLGVMACGIVLRVLPYQLGIWSEIGNYLLTIVWIIGITNAMNFFDGMDGLATGLGALIAFFLGVVAFQTAQPFLGRVAVAMMGACTGFLPYNFKIRGSGVIFLGDAGSTVIGFVLACVAVYGDWATSNPVVALVSPLLIFWILIFDMVHISIERILTGKVYTFRQWIDYVGKDHLHHRLACTLGTNQRSVMFIFLMNFCLGISAISLRNARPVDAALLILQAAIFVILITILERRGRPLRVEPMNKVNPFIPGSDASPRTVADIRKPGNNINAC
jgi:UDP-GlcNAc:undecaprenyl-phosphate GlcNAc-1-phosphate transferase